MNEPLFSITYNYVRILIPIFGNKLYVDTEHPTWVKA